MLVLLAAGAFVGLALLLGGTLRAEAVLGVANLVWLVFVAIGGVIVPLSTSPEWVRVAGGLTPAGALSNGLRSVLTDGRPPSALAIAGPVGLAGDRVGGNLALVPVDLIAGALGPGGPRLS